MSIDKKKTETCCDLLAKKNSNRSPPPNWLTFALLKNLQEDGITLKEKKLKNYPTIGQILPLSSASQRLGKFSEATRDSKTNDVKYNILLTEDGRKLCTADRGNIMRLELGVKPT